MSLELYSLTNFFALAIMLAGLILPALIIYFYSGYKSYLALVISVVVLALPAVILKEHTMVLIPFMLPVLFSGLTGILLKKAGQEFWYSMAYMILAEMVGIVTGVVIIYFHYGMQDIATLISEGFRNTYLSLPANDEIGASGLNLMIWMLGLAQNGVAPDYNEIVAKSMAEKLDMIVPLIKVGMAKALPSYVMSYGIISGVWAWFLSSVMVSNRVKDKKPLEGIKEYTPHPPLSDWKLPRWLTNVLMLMLLVSILMTFAAQSESVLNIASAVQTAAVTILGIQGLAVVNWWMKSKKKPVWVTVIVCVVAVVFLGFLLPWLGVFDIVFSIRMSQQQKEAIKKRMEEIKKQVDEQMHEMEDENKDNKNSEDSEDKDNTNSEDESEDEK